MECFARLVAELWKPGSMEEKVGDAVIDPTELDLQRLSHGRPGSMLMWEWTRLQELGGCFSDIGHGDKQQFYDVTLGALEIDKLVFGS